MHFTAALNIILGSAVLVVLIFIDYTRKYNTDAYQRHLFSALLVFTFLAMLADFAYYLAVGIPGTIFRNVIYVSLLAYYVFQNLAFYYCFLFFDFILTKNQRRIAGFKIGVWAVTALHCFVLLLNHKRQFYFAVSADNTLIYGSHYFIRMIISCLPGLFMLFDLFLIARSNKTIPIMLTRLLPVLTGISSAVDLLFKTSSLIWPCFAGSLLYVYFFIIQTDSKIDALTGLGNRNSFNEFVSKLSNACGKIRSRPELSGQRRSRRQNPFDSCSIVMIDMDHFKMINDTLGHLEGDNALRDMAGIIKSCVRKSDFAARYGGDEFILATRAEYDINSLLGRIQAAIDDLNAKNKRPYKLQISYGHDVYNIHSGIPITDFLKHIDGLMYKHKNERRRSSDKENNQEKNEHAVLLS
ncbi:MAG: GGDEF domain-containing protein [Treponema sp.]|nr:GGDEF domain-containing protein [Treponema sp.]